MYLFINTLSEKSCLILFNEKRDILAQERWEGKQKEFDSLIEKIDELLEKHQIPYKNLSGMVVVRGPGSFTGTRVTTLVANTLAVSYNIPLFPLEVGDIFSYEQPHVPWIMPITKRELLVGNRMDKKTHLIQKTDLPSWTYATMSVIDFEESKYTMLMVDSWENTITKAPLDSPQKYVTPLYAKDPNITPKSPLYAS